MIRKFPVLLKTQNDLYKTIELKKPSSRVLADTKEAMRTSNKYIAMRNFVAGCTVKIIGENEITEPDRIKLLIGKSSNLNIEYFSREVIIDFFNGDDFVEGIYTCPRCHTDIIAEKRNNDGIITDTRDRMSDLKVVFMENESELEFLVEFSNPVLLESEANSTEVNTILMGFPTIENMVQAYSMVGDDNEVKFQYAIYGNSVIKVNNQPIDDKWRRSYGYKLFNSIENVKTDLNEKISDVINKYGVDPRIEKTCTKCGKVWQPNLNSLNFFDSALR